uniref:Uncharacterized protein MANES_15G147400 n=1 Tax=Rhizophora mucronata TaxID=61149 RepID=A0A2P2JJZ8_RHIMU
MHLVAISTNSWRNEGLELELYIQVHMKFELSRFNSCQ